MQKNISSMVDSVELTNRISTIYRKRTEKAQERFSTRMREAIKNYDSTAHVKSPWEIWETGYSTRRTQPSGPFCSGTS